MSTNGLFEQSLSLDSAIESNFLSVEGHTSVREVLQIMSSIKNYCFAENTEESLNTVPVNDQLSSPNQNYFFSENTLNSCVLITENKVLIGIFTERDLVDLIAHQIDLAQLKIKDLITRSPITLEYIENLNIFNALSVLRQHQIRHLPIVNHQQQPIGIITNETIRKSLQPVNLLTRVRHVEDVMTTQVITADLNDSILSIAQLMTNYRISSIVIIEKARNSPIPLGIITEKDIVQFKALELDFAHTTAQMVMSSPVFSSLPNTPIWDANQMMNYHNIRRIIITKATGELMGIVSQSSLLQVLNPTDMYGLIEILQDILEEKTQKLEEKNKFLRQEIYQRKKAEKNLIFNHQRLQEEVEKRTEELLKVNQELQQDIQQRQKVELALRESEHQLKQQTEQLKETLFTLQNTQLKLIQTEKMSSVGQLVAGIAHEINNPINFIYGNTNYAQEYINQLLELIELYQQTYPSSTPDIQEKTKEIELDFLKEDLNKLMKSMKIGAERIRDLVASLRNFSRLHEAKLKTVNIHEGIDNTLLILQNQLILKDSHQGIQVMKEYGQIPEIECYPGQLNQVFMNIIANAIDSLQEAFIQDNIKPITIQGQQFNFPILLIKTENSPDQQHIIIRIIDNGVGMSEATLKQLFNPFFTTKEVGKGTGLSLSISYQIIAEKHKGTLECLSSLETGSEFIITIPKHQSQPIMWPL